MQWQIFGFLFFIGTCFAEIELPTDFTKLDQIPEVKKECEKRGKPDTYDRLKVAINETATCLKDKIVPTKIKDELEEAKKTGSMDEVFGKYCKKRQEYKDCILKTVNVSKECLGETEISALDRSITVIDEVIEFVCYRDGDRLAMFVAEGGTECLSSRQEQIRDCVNATLKINTENFSLNSITTNLPSLTIDKNKCDDLARIQQCVVNDLETNCKDTTPANIVDALFKFIKKSTCKNVKQKRSVRFWRVKRNIGIHALKMIEVSAINQKLSEECKRNGGDDAVNDFWNLESLVEFAYDHLNLNKLTPKSEIVFCLQRIKSSGGIQKNLPKCSQGLVPDQTNAQNHSLPNKATICKLWNEVDECFNTFIRNTCAPDIAVDIILGNLTKAIQRPCRDEK